MHPCGVHLEEYHGYFDVGVDHPRDPALWIDQVDAEMRCRDLQIPPFHMHKLEQLSILDELGE
jgi:hypothetical protein